MKKRIAFYILIVLILLFSACGKTTEEKWQEQYDLGQQYLLEENYEEAIVAFTAAIEIEPNQTGAYIGRGNAYVLSGETEEHLAQALADYQRVLELNVEAYLGIADVYIRQGDYEAALDILNEGLEKMGGNEEISAKIAEIESGNITDSSGNARRMSSYAPSGTLMWYHEYTYDGEGRQSSVTSYDADGNQTGHVDLSYNDEGLPLVSRVYHGDDGAVGRWVFERDDSGNAIREEVYEADGSLSDSFIHQYDTNGNLVYSENYNSNGELSGTEEYEYSENGQQAKRTGYDGDGVMAWYETYEYDSNGSKRRLNHYDPSGQLNWYELYQYDENGDLLGFEQYDGSGNLTQTVTSEKGNE